MRRYASKADFVELRAGTRISLSTPAYTIPPVAAATASCTEPARRFIVQTLGPHGRTYELQAHKAPAIYVAHQTVNVPPQQQQLYVQQAVQQLHSSAFKNPLLVNTNYPQMPSADSYYNAPQATVATATHVQPATHYGPPQLQLQPQQKQPHNSNPQPYAIVTLPTGQRVQDAGHGSGPSPMASGNFNQPPRLGDYSAQSQIDGDHQQLLQAARAQTQPAASGCKKNSVYVPPGAQQNDKGQLRPRGRRTYPHVQEQLVKYPYN
ncbi:uncharacterized protein LOC117789453 [Drosophila innubila]|uniref:uncharacterized protein LOC117789453 n=1 Tax=Drosophila innubila TaxID=198719 RepID=UPI00148DDB47|nr:uncharacterized protein LOC117789453 [Drosophila innubila]